MKNKIIIILLFIIFSEFLAADGSYKDILLSASEISYPPYCITEDGEAGGFSVELLRETLKVMNYDVSFKVDTWYNVKNMLETGVVQVLPLVGRTPEREAFFDFTFPYLKQYGTIVVNEKNIVPSSFLDLEGLSVGVLKGDNAEEFVRKNPVKVNIAATETFDEALVLLSEDKIDAVVIQRYLAEQLITKLDLKNLKVSNNNLEGFVQAFCFAVTEGDTYLLNILNEGLAEIISNGTFERIKNKWLRGNTLSKKENRRIIVGGDSAYPPYEFLDSNGNPSGFNVELSKAIAEEMDLEIEISLNPWTSTYNKLLSGEIDIVQGLFYSEERNRTFGFSPPHSIINHSVIARKDSIFPETIEDLQKMTVIVMEDDLMYEFAVDNGINNIVTGKTLEKALILLSEGKGDCVLGAELPASFYIKKNDLNNLIITDMIVDSSEYNFGTLHKNEDLLKIFSHGLSLLNESGEYRKIYSKWLGIYESNDDFEILEHIKLFFLILIPFVIIIIVILIWNKTLKISVNQKTLDLMNMTTELNFKIKEIDETKEYIHTALHSIKDSVITTNLHGEITDINHSGELLTGKTINEVINKSTDILFTVNKNQQSINFQNEIVKVIDDHESFNLNEGCSILIEKDLKIDVTISCNPITTDNGNTIGAIIVLRDISNELLLQEQLNQKNKMDSIGQLAGGIAHDFNNQLAGILGYSELLLKQSENPKNKKYIEKIIQITESSSSLTKQLLSFARKGNYNKEIINIISAVEDVADILEHTIDKKIKIIKNIQVDSAFVRGDYSQIQNSILNIALNAKDAIFEKGKIIISVNKKNIKNNILLNSHFTIPPDEYITLSVNDDGCGMTEETKKRIFEPFFTTKEVGRGSGMGLASVYGIMKSHNGYIDVISDVSTGTEIILYFPVESGGLPENKEVEKIFNKNNSNNNILIIDDNLSYTEIFREHLEDDGYSVNVFNNGLEGLEHYKSNTDKYFILILDYMMPEISGKEIFDEIMKLNKSQKVIVSSGYNENEGNINDMIKSGCYLLKKPFSINDLNKIIYNL